MTYFLFALAFQSAISASDVDCTDRPECWPEGSAMHTGLVAKQQFADADKRLNAMYARIMSSLPADEPDNYPKKSPVTAQREWIKYRDANCASVGEVSGGVRMWKSAYTAICEAEMTEERIKDLVRTFNRSDGQSRR